MPIGITLYSYWLEDIYAHIGRQKKRALYEIEQHAEEHTSQ